MNWNNNLILKNKKTANLSTSGFFYRIHPGIILL